jgi:hypothetical protein
MEDLQRVQNYLNVQYNEILNVYISWETRTEAKHYSFIRESLETQIQFEPDVETRNRKPLKRPVVFGAKWELRFGTDNRFRVSYRVDYDHQQVILLAIGEKIGNRLFVGGEEIKL